MQLSTRSICFELMDKCGMYDNIKEHSKMVEKVGMFLAGELKKKEIEIDVDLVSRARLLRDIGKVAEIEGGDKRDKICERILTQEGYERLGKFCRNHYLGKEDSLKNWEDKILNYADKRAPRDKIVSLNARMEDLKIRYPSTFNQKTVQNSYELEQEIFSQLDIQPEKINEKSIMKK